MIFLSTPLIFISIDFLKGFFDFDEGMSYAKEINKPVLLDFTGHGCVNCRDIEARVWPDQRVRDILNNDYVLVSLYVEFYSICFGCLRLVSNL